MRGFDKLAGFKPDAVVVTRERVLQAFRLWEDDKRSGQCLSTEEVEALSVDKLAEERADAFFSYLERA